jgi:hypothetical protein
MAQDYKHIGADEFSRDLYRNSAGHVAVDVDGQLHSRTVTHGEPIAPIGVPTSKDQ